MQEQNAREISHARILESWNVVKAEDLKELNNHGVEWA